VDQLLIAKTIPFLMSLVILLLEQQSPFIVTVLPSWDIVMWKDWN
jgi:hypothetical protein